MNINVEKSTKYWYIPLIIGLLFIGLGVYTLSSPLESYLALSLLFSLSFLFSGLFETVFSIANRKELGNWGWTLIFGIGTLFIGLLLVTNPAISATTLPLYVGFLVLFRSIGAVSYAFDLKKGEVKGWWQPLIFGILGMLFSFMLIRNPIFAGITIVFWTGLALITNGLFGISLSFLIRSLKNEPEALAEELQEGLDGIDKDLKMRMENK